MTKAPRQRSQNKTIRVYGHGPGQIPFYQEAQTAKVTSKGCLLILNAPVSRGQKLLLMNRTQENPVEAEVVMTRTLGERMCEVEVCFPA